VQQLRIDISSLLEDLGARNAVEGELPLDYIAVGDEVYHLLEPASFSIELTNTGAGVVANGTVGARTSAACSRCLEPFELEIDAEVEAFYAQPGHEQDVADDTEIEPIFPDGTIDLAPALQAALTLEAPFAPVHDESCAGLCPACGCNLNEEQCGCHVELEGVSPFAGLKELFTEDDL
jgi:uncharacterized protein